MADDETLLPVKLGAREIPPPRTISAEARAYLVAAATNPVMSRPAADDRAGWQAAIEASAATWQAVAEAMLANAAASVTERSIAGVRCYVATPKSSEGAADAPLYIYAHGGAFLFGGGLFARAYAAANADRLGCSVVSVDYRMPPDHPFPAAPEDMVGVYRVLCGEREPARIAIGGSSAGGNIAASAALMIRDRGLAMPAALVLMTPEVDLTEAGDSFRTNALIDVVLKHGLPECNAFYAGGRDLADPYLSPLFADLAGLPPTLVQTGTRDLFLSNAVLFHRKLRRAGVAAELHVWEAMPHGGFGGTTPEDAEIYVEVAAFLDRHCRG